MFLLEVRWFHAVLVCMDIHTFKRWCSKVQVGTKDECWEWTGERNDKGYGQLRQCGKYKKSHRLSYEHFTGRQLGKLLCCHTCDNPSCVNPNHLFAGTNQDNMDDCVRKGRHAYALTMLSASDRDLICRFPRRHKMLEFLGRWFGLSPRQVANIRLHGTKKNSA